MQKGQPWFATLGDMKHERRARSADPRPARTRQALIDATQRLLMTRSLDALTIDEIVSAAEVGRGSFYNHFADKEMLGSAIVARIRDHLDSEIATVNDGVTNPAERVMRALFASVHFTIAHPETARVVVNLGLTTTDPDSPVNIKIVKDLELGLSTGAFSIEATDVGVSIIVGLISVAMRHVLEGWVKDSPYWTELAARMSMALGVAPDEATRLAQRIAREFDPAIVSIANLDPLPTTSAR
jgi:AcrR family transcriptional regulator